MTDTGRSDGEGRRSAGVAQSVETGFYRLLREPVFLLVALFRRLAGRRRG